MKNFSHRIAALSAGQLKLLKLKLKQEGIDFDRDIKKVERNIFPSVEPAEEKEYYPLSSVQKRLFTLSQVEGTGNVFIVSTMRIIRENLDKRRVEEAFNALIQRHQSFRTSFVFIGSEPVQRIHDEVNFEIRYFDFKIDGVEAEVKFEETIKNLHHPFDLAQAPLLRVGMIKLAEKKYVLIIDMHHIMSDALCKRIIWDEFNRLYNGRSLKELKLQYKDFSVWCSSEEVQSVLQHQETYWLKEFQGKIPVINLPTDWERPVNKRFEGGYQVFKINKKTTSALKTLALKENATLFAIMLAVYNVFLSKISRQKDIVVGVPTGGRHHPGLDDIIGMFVNTLVLRNYPEDEKTFADFLRQVRQRTLEAFANQDYQFEDLVNQVVKQRDTSRNPIFDVFFSFRAPGVTQELPVSLSDDEGSPLKPDKETTGTGAETTLSMFDLYLQGAEIKEEIFLVLVYSTKLFKKETIKRFVNYITDIILSVTGNNQVKLKDIKISHDLGIADSTFLQDEKEDFGF
ncbi:MAG: hypothetical protein JSV88_10465 [Candidatus Aminicenantes bacterium]|nr:MAG: hypothetical protein JSV88_10465 [Candidatus Aminicenantes bacterium]